MQTHEIDDVMFRLGDVFDAYGKKIGQGAFRVWREFFVPHDKQACINAIEKYMRTEKHAPRISDIQDLLNATKTARGEGGGPAYAGDDPLTKAALEATRTGQRATGTISTAWILYHKIVFGGNPPVPGGKPTVAMTKDEAILIVNQQAKKHNMPDAIADEHKLEEVWGDYLCLNYLS